MILAISRAWGVVLKSWKPLLVVFAFSCAVTLAVGAYRLGQQGERLDTVVATNRGLADALEKAEIAREIEQAHAAELQVKLDVIAASSDEANARLRQLEKSNAEVKEFLSTRTPDAMRGVLTGKNTSATR